jgi:hypothetical protein
MEPIGVDHRVTAGLGDLRVFEAAGSEQLGQPLGGKANVRGVLWQGRDTREPQEVLVALEACL